MECQVVSRKVRLEEQRCADLITNAMGYVSMCKEASACTEGHVVYIFSVLSTVLFAERLKCADALVENYFASPQHQRPHTQPQHDVLAFNLDADIRHGPLERMAVNLDG